MSDSRGSPRHTWRELLDARRRRAIYRAGHRGTKEMDWLLGRFAEARVPTMGQADLELFERFLEMPDPQLQSWILDPSRLGESEFHLVLEVLRNFHGLEDC